MEILPGIETEGPALYIREQEALVISDLHIGQEEALNSQGILVPRFQLRKVFAQLEKILVHIKPAKIIINGDLKHEFGRISEQEWRDTLKVLDHLGRHAKELILVKGNHDTILGPIAGKRGIKVVDSLALGNLLIIHGHRVPSKAELAKACTIIMGHEHPAITIRDGPRTELFKCFLSGKYHGKNLIVMPSFNFVTEGTDILREQLLSPLLKDIRALGAFKVYITEEGQTYEFGTVRSILAGL